MCILCALCMKRGKKQCGNVQNAHTHTKTENEMSPFMFIEFLFVCVIGHFMRCEIANDSEKYPTKMIGREQ